MPQGHGYTWDAADYAQSSFPQKQWAGELISKMHLTGRERVLDIGCGDGRISAALAVCVPDGSVTGCDCSPEMICFARGQFPARKYPNLSFVEGDATDLRFPEQFDVVFSNAALHWIYDHGPVLAGISRALVSGGRMIVQMGGKGNAAGIYACAGAPASRTRMGALLYGLFFQVRVFLTGRISSMD